MINDIERLYSNLFPLGIRYELSELSSKIEFDLSTISRKLRFELYRIETQKAVETFSESLFFGFKNACLKIISSLFWHILCLIMVTGFIIFLLMMIWRSIG